MSQRNDPLSRLADLAGKAPSRAPNVRTLARYAANSHCTMASVGFAARVDFDRLLVGTRYEVPFGQSPFAFRRGNLFEDLLRRDGHAPIKELLGRGLGYDASKARVVNLREGAEKTRVGMAKRAVATGELVDKVLGGAADAPNLIDGAVMAKEVGGVMAYFEADAVAAQFDSPIHAGEIKSFPTVDGQADADKVGAAISQVAIYILLLRDVVVGLGGDPDSVASKALLITPKNTGLQPTMTVKDVGREVDRAARILAQAPSAGEIVDSLPASLPSFEAVASKALGEPERLDAVEQLVESVGTSYGPACLSSCGLSRLCRQRAHRSGDPARVGGQLVRLLPGISSLDRAAALAAGGRASADEQPVADELRRASDLLDAVGSPPPAASRKGRAR